MIGKLQRVPLDVLNDALDITLSSAEREQSARAFNVDLVAERRKNV